MCTGKAQAKTQVLLRSKISTTLQQLLLGAAGPQDVRVKATLCRHLAPATRAGRFTGWEDAGMTVLY